MPLLCTIYTSSYPSTHLLCTPSHFVHTHTHTLTHTPKEVIPAEFEDAHTPWGNLPLCEYKDLLCFHHVFPYCVVLFSSVQRLDFISLVRQTGLPVSPSLSKKSSLIQSKGSFMIFKQQNRLFFFHLIICRLSFRVLVCNDRLDNS